MKRIVIPLIALSLALAGLLAYRELRNAYRVTHNVERGKSSSGYALLDTRSSTTTIDADKFLVPELYESAWTVSPESGPCRSYRGAIVNHHALASDLIVKVAREIARCRSGIKTIIILSPDHYSAGSTPVSIHRKSYATTGDLVDKDEKSMNRLREAIPLAGESASLFEREHGVGVIVPFLHRVMPDVALVPVAIKSSIDTNQRLQLTKWLSDESKRGSFILVSADMSHYLDDSVAIKNDEATKRALVDSDSDFFASAKDGFTDNGPSIAATIAALQPKRWQLIDQAISSDYAGSNGFTTTYLIGFWN
jgi:AmmeMemoRadiSam system protein B